MSSETGNTTPAGGARLPYLPALDGLRAVAVISVLLYHASVAWLPGGFLGVEMFFVISGYLITSMLLAEWSQTGGIDLKTFWLRRARRLFPALFTLLVVVVAYAVLFLPEEVAGLRGDVLSTAAYVNNWYQIFSHKSYFESAGRPPLLRHMWSLAVEEQFYLLWPLLLGLLLRRQRPGRVLAMVLLGALASLLLMVAGFKPDTDPSRIYYGTDTRAAGLLLGAALAFTWPPGKAVLGGSQRVLDAIGLGALVTLLACFLLITEFQSFLYRGGFTLVGLATVELLAIVVHPQARLTTRLMCWEPLRWVGLRSYGIYLWHFPVFMVTRPQLDLPWDGVPVLLLRLGLTLAIAALSYRFIETPIRNGCLGRYWLQMRAAQGPERRGWEQRWAAAAGSAVVVLAVLGGFLMAARPPAPPDYLTAHAAEPLPGGFNAAPGGPGPATLLALTATNPEPPAAALPVASSNSPPPAPLIPTSQPAKGGLVIAIGDSVMEGVAAELKGAFGASVLINAHQGRLPWHAPAIIRGMHIGNQTNPVVILHLGNNGIMSLNIFNEIMAEFKNARRILVVNVKVPRRWEAPNNDMLASAIKDYPNAVLVDWHRVGVSGPKMFWKDGIHVRPEGARVYVDLILKALKGA